jgi:hypothetical protein
MTFAKLAPLLAARGFNPVPIAPNTKAPTIVDWQIPRPPEAWPAKCATWGVGILAATAPAIDLDLRHAELVELLVEMADDTLGGAPLRIGQPPKSLLAFSTSEPFAKTTTRWLALPGEPFDATGYQPHRIEVLGSGQQWVAYAVHPGTGKPYIWPRGCILDLDRLDLPELTTSTAARFVEASERVLIAAGCIPIRKGAGGRWERDLPRPHHHPAPTTPNGCSGGSGDRWDRSWQEMGAEAIAKRVDPGAYRSSGGWRVKCPVHQGQSDNSLVITNSEAGGIVAHCFAGCRYPEIAAELERICA